MSFKLANQASKGKKRTDQKHSIGNFIKTAPDERKRVYQSQRIYSSRERSVSTQYLSKKGNHRRDGNEYRSEKKTFRFYEQDLFIAFHGPRERRSVIICKLTCRLVKIRKEDKGEHSKNNYDRNEKEVQMLIQSNLTTLA